MRIKTHRAVMAGKEENELTVSLWRGDQTGAYQTYRVPRRENQTVLDVVTFVQRHLDPTLAYRFACRVGMCGSCAMTVNGRPRWTCRTHVSKVAQGGRVEIGPLANLPVIKDLAVDMTPFFDKWQRAKGVFAPSRTRRDPINRISPASPPRLDVRKRRPGCREPGALGRIAGCGRVHLLPLAPVLPGALPQRPQPDAL